MPINTVFQLLADEGSPALAGAERIALVPDLLALWLSGELANEATAASTTGLLDAASGTWARGLAERLGLPARLFRDVVEPGTALGPLLPHHAAGDAPVFTVAATTPPPPSSPRRCATSTPRSSRAARGACSGWSWTGRTWATTRARRT